MNDELIFPDWLVNLMEMSERERASCARDTLEEVAYFSADGKTSKEPTEVGRAILKEITNSRNYRIVGFTPNFMYVPVQGEPREKVSVGVWKKPMLLMKHLNSPILIVTGASVADQAFVSRKVDVPKVDPKERDSNEVVSFLSWVSLLLKAPPQGRMRIKEVVLSDLRKYGSKEGKPTREGLTIEKALGSSDFECIGFMPNVMYLKVKGNAVDLQALYVHPWGTPKLIFRHKLSPTLMIVGTDLRLDESIVGEVAANRYFRKVGGLTG